MVDDSDMVIEPRREKTEKAIPPVGLLLLNPSEARWGERKAKSQGGAERFLFHGHLTVVPAAGDNGSFFVAGPAVGAPMAVMTLEKLIALGARKVIVSGWCGSLLPGVEPLSVVLPTWAVCEEGTSPHYPISGRAEADPGLRCFLEKFLPDRGFTVRSGPIWTTDALYRETRDKVRQYGAQGIVAVEMEYSALAAVAVFRRISLAAALIVSDSLWQETWQPKYKNKEFRRRSTALLEALFTMAGAIAAQES